MATTPQPPPKSPPKPEPPHTPSQQHSGTQHDPLQTDAPQHRSGRDPEPEESAKPVGETQLESSREIEDKGIDAHNREQEMHRSKQRQVPGVAATDPDKPGTPYNPPEGHTNKNPGPGDPGGPSAGHYHHEDNVQGTGTGRDRDSEAAKAAKDQR